MAALFGGGGGSSPAPAPPAPSRSAQEIQDAAEAQRRQFYGAQGGRASTSLTGGMGTSTPTSAIVRLLGDVGRI